MRLRRTAAVAALSIALLLTACGSAEYSGPAGGSAARTSLPDATLEKLTMVGTVAGLRVTEPPRTRFRRVRTGPTRTSAYPLHSWPSPIRRAPRPPGPSASSRALAS